MVQVEEWLIALRAPGMGGQRLISLVEGGGGVANFVASPASKLRQQGLTDEGIAALRRPDELRLAQDLEWLAAEGHHLLPYDHEDYPPMLKRISSPPAVLFVAGDPGVLWQAQIAVIGSRNPTAGGLDHARAFSAELAVQGLAITSGLACGIDVTAHEAALEAGGLTIAVNGTGLDRVYPAANTAVAQRIRARGALVSELPPGSEPKRSHFPSRNRIIAGLSLGVLVIEAGLNSGSLITARLAGDQGREVFALPGSLHNPMARGCHRLIKQGARLVESTQDIIGELAPLAQELALELRRQLGPDEPRPQPVPAQEGNMTDDPDYARLWEAIGFDPVSVDTLVRRSGMAAREVSSMLLMLELNGKIEFQLGGRVSRLA